MKLSSRQFGSPNAKTGFTVAATLAVMAALTAPAAHAGFVTEQNLTAVYSANPPFDNTNQVTVFWLSPVITITSVIYNTINTVADQNALFALPGQTVMGKYGNGPIQQITLPSSPVDDVFFIDNINFCGGPGDGIVGCAPVGGQGIMLNSDFAALGGGFGTQLEGHELGHNLGLQHCQTAPATCPAGVPPAAPANQREYPDLMNAFINGDTTLTAAQATTILGSALVQNNLAFNPNGGNYIDLQPIVFAPEPTDLAFFGLGMSLFFLVRRRRRSAMSEK
jgi:hypothetical protein